jgi:hypothetical protein
LVEFSNFSIFDARSFPQIVETTAYICDFHREQAWERWLSKTANGLSGQKQVVLAMLRAIAKARTECDYEKALNVLKKSKVWIANKNLRNWMNGTWLNNSKVHLVYNIFHT